MLPLEPIADFVESILSEGVSERAEIVRRVRERFEGDVSQDVLVHTFFDKRVSLAIASFRDDLGQRLAFPGRNEEGKRVVIDMRFSTDAAAMRATGIRLQHTGHAMVRAGDRLIDRAEQLELQFPVAA